MTEEPRYHLSDFNSIPDRAILEAGPNGKPANLKWPQTNLADPAYAQPPQPPAIAGILYHAKRHVLSGPQESAKTLIAYHLILTAIRAGHPAAIIDLEMGPTAARRMLTELGATETELEQLFYTEPDGPPTTNDLHAIQARNTQYALIDAAAGAFDTTGLDDNSRKDAEKFSQLWIAPLFKAEIATIVLDHVTKNADTRGKYAIGSERKTGGADIHLGIDTIVPLRRGGTGIYKLTTHKDRGGYLQRGRLADIHIGSDPETHQITLELREVDHGTDDEPWMPTIVMQKVSEHLANQTEPVSFNNVITTLGGKEKIVHQALEHLIRLDHITERRGPRNARNVTLNTPYTSPPPTSAPPPPGGSDLTSAHPPYYVGGVGAEVDAEERSTTSAHNIDVYDPAVQQQLGDDDIPF